MKFKGNIPSTKHVGFHNNFHKINEIGLQKAYNSDKKIHVDGDTLFIAGTSNKQDVYDDLTQIPFYGDVRDSRRYKDVIETVKTNPNVKKLTGHSLGGAVALELEKSIPNTSETTTYGAPVFGGFGKGNRFRHRGDPISAFDFGAKSVGFSFNAKIAHSYTGY